MAAVSPLLSSLNSGELSPRMAARVEFDRYPNAAALLRNMVLYPQGGAARRPGTRHVAEAKNSANATKVLPFVYSQDDSYIVEMGDLYARFYRRQGRLDVDDTDAAISNGTFASNITDWDDISTTADFPTVAATNTSATTPDGTSHTISLPSGIVAGDLLLIIFRTGGANATHNTPSGWTLLATRSSNGTSSIYYRVADGSEASTVTITSPNSRDSAHISYRIQNFHGTPEGSFAGSNTLDPPSVTPSWGSANTLFIAHASTRRTDNSFTSAPTSYSGLVQSASIASNASTDHCRVATAERDVAGASDDPGVFSTSGTTDNPHAATIAIQPLPVAGSIEHDSTNGRLQLNGVEGAASIAEQDVAVGAGNISNVHVLQFRVAGFGNGTAGFRVGTVSGEDDVLEEVELGIGEHSIELTPGATTIYVQFINRANPVQDMWIDNVAFIDDAPMEVVSPYSSADLTNLSTYQAADIVYLLHPDYAPRRLERRGHRSWSIVEAFYEDGPYLAVNGGSDIDSEQLFANPLFENGLDEWDVSNSAGDGFVEHSQAGQFAELDPGTSGGSGDARLESSVTTISGLKHVAHVLIIAAGPVDLKFGTSVGNGSYVDEAVQPGWHSFEFTTTTTALHAQFFYDEYTKSRAAVGACLVYNENVRLLQPSATTGEVTITARGFSPFKSTDVGRLLRLTWPGREPGYGVITAYGSAQSVTVLVLREFADTTPTEDWRFGAWGGTQGFPKAMGFFDGRSVLANTALKPRTMWLSQSSQLQNMRPDSWVEGAATVEDDDAIDVTLESTRIDPILWIAGQRQLVVGTTGGQWIISSTGAVLTPSDRSAKQHTAVPTADIQHVAVNQVTLFADKSKREVHDIGFRFEDDSFVATDLTILADHILRSPVQEFAYQRRPYSTIWARRADGRLAALSYNRQHDVLGWSQSVIGGAFSTGDAVVESIAVIPGAEDANQQYDSDERDELWMVVKRTINGGTKRYIEFMEYFFDGPLREDYDTEDEWRTAVLSEQRDAFYVDSGLTYDGAATDSITGLDHLEGETVKVLANGKVLPDKTVASGAVSVPTGTTKAQAGLGYKHRYESLKIAVGGTAGTSVNKVKIITGMGFVLLDTGTFKTTTVDYDKSGRRQHQLYTIDLRKDGADPSAAVPLYTGEHAITTGGSYSGDARMYCEGDAPLPFALLGLAPKVTTVDQAPSSR